MFSGIVRRRWLWNTSFTTKKRHIKISKPPKNFTLPTHTQQPTVEAEATKATQNLRPPSLSVSLFPLANFPTYARTTNVQTLKLLLCALYRLYNPSTRSSNPTRPIQRQEARSGPRPQTQYPFKTFTSHYTAADERQESSVLNNNPLPSYQDGRA